MNISSLLKLAHDKSEDGRRLLAHELSQLYSGKVTQHNKQDLNSSEVEIVHEILNKLIQVAQKDIRKLLAEELAAVPTMPRNLIKKLAHDEFEIAQPILINSPVLQDQDLIEIIKTMEPAYSLAISKRKNISQELASCLIDEGRVDPIHQLLLNPEVNLTDENIDQILNLACEEDVLQPPLIERKEMTREIAGKLYWFAAESIRSTLIKKFRIDKALIDKYMNKSIKKLIDSATATQNELTAKQKILANKMGAAGTINYDFLIFMLRLKQYLLFKYCFGLYFKLNSHVVDSIINEIGGKKLAILCKAMRFDKSRFATLFLLARSTRAGEQVVDPNELSVTLRYFASVSETRAMMYLSKWQESPDSYWSFMS